MGVVRVSDRESAGETAGIPREKKVKQLAKHYNIPIYEADRLLANMEARHD